MLKISIVIPCYNDADFVEQAVQSALDQTYLNKEIIVVDDGSGFKTKKVLKDLEPKVDLLITQDNKGTSTARNNGIKAATGEYILVLDSDDYFEPQFCEKSMKIFNDQEDVKIVTCYTNWFQNDNGSKIFHPKGGSLKDLLINNSAMGSAIFRRRDWEKIQGYDEKMTKGFEDWEFYIRLMQLGGQISVIPEVLFNYRNKQNSRNKKANITKYELMEYIYIKHEKLYTEHFTYFIKEWLDSVKKSEYFKQQVMDSIDYKIGNKLLKPFRSLGFFKK